MAEVVEITATTVVIRTETGLRELNRSEVAAVTYAE